MTKRDSATAWPISCRWKATRSRWRPPPGGPARAHARTNGRPRLGGSAFPRRSLGRVVRRALTPRPLRRRGTCRPRPLLRRGRREGNSCLPQLPLRLRQPLLHQFQLALRDQVDAVVRFRAALLLLDLVAKLLLVLLRLSRVLLRRAHLAVQLALGRLQLLAQWLQLTGHAGRRRSWRPVLQPVDPRLRLVQLGAKL